jgi:hypothetical protein
VTPELAILDSPPADADHTVAETGPFEPDARGAMKSGLAEADARPRANATG